MLNAAGRRKKSRAIPIEEAAPQGESRATSSLQDQKRAAQPRHKTLRLLFAGQRR
jgi:hypothetical protein